MNHNYLDNILSLTAVKQNIGITIRTGKNLHAMNCRNK